MCLFISPRWTRCLQLLMLGVTLASVPLHANAQGKQEYHRKAQEIRAKGLGMTYADEQEMIAYERAALNCMLN
jgi:hypothetical protein